MSMHISSHILYCFLNSLYKNALKLITNRNRIAIYCVSMCSVWKVTHIYKQVKTHHHARTRAHTHSCRIYRHLVNCAYIIKCRKIAQDNKLQCYRIPKMKAKFKHSLFALFCMCKTSMNFHDIVFSNIFSSLDKMNWFYFFLLLKLNWKYLKWIEMTLELQEKYSFNTMNKLNI